jgi:hypothetical protein
MRESEPISMLKLCPAAFPVTVVVPDPDETAALPPFADAFPPQAVAPASTAAVTTATRRT